MKYSEIFYTLQGEGQLVGVPSVFFRSSFCNLRCSWCDTAYASWYPEDKDISVFEALKKITKFGVKHVVITGGEPFLQKEELTTLCEMLFAKGHHITIETNATVFVPVQASLISMSPKLSNSTPVDDKQWKDVHNKERFKPDIMRLFLDKYECQARFVISDIQDIQEVRELAEQVPIPKETIILMPQGVEISKIEECQKWLVEVCKETGYRYSPRLHLNIWGNKRGT
jgi:7-carboxy-7-deazaguanine synthase